MDLVKLEFDLDGALAIVTLNDPASLNAMSLPMAEQMGPVLDEALSSARAMILTGEGRAFCSGAKLDGSAIPLGVDGLPDIGASLETHINPVLERLKCSPIPWITAVRGPAAGVGCGMALAGDLIVASRTALFIQAFAAVGLAPDGGSSWLLSRAVGRPRAMEMMLLGEKITAERALEWGLINRVVEDEALEDEALKLATRLARGPASLSLVRRAAWLGAESNWTEALSVEREYQKLAGRTADHREGVAAFMEKRPARFTGD